MKNPTGEEIWGEGDWWRRRIGKPEIDEHLGRHGLYLPDNKSQVSQKNYRYSSGTNQKQLSEYDMSSWKRLIPWFLRILRLFILNPAVIYGLGALLVKVIWGSWFFGIVRPILAPFWILAKFI